MSQRMVFKITVLGEGGVGKTALTVQFTMSSFVETYDPTIEDCYRKQWTVDDQPCLLEVLDTAGQEEYTSLRDQWIRDGEGFLVVYSVTNPGSYESVENIVERVKVVKGEGQDVHPGLPNRGGDSATVRVPIVIVGNKRDLPNDRRVSTDMGRALAERLHCKFFETSARIHDDVEAVFKEIVRQIKVAKNLHNPPRGGPEPVSPSGSTQPGSSRSRKTKKCVIL